MRYLSLISGYNAVTENEYLGAMHLVERIYSVAI